MTGSFRGIFLKRRGASRLHGGRSTRWVLPYQETLPNWPDVRPGLGTRLAVQSIARNGQRNVKYLSLNPLSRIFHPTDAVTVGESFSLALSISWFAKDNQVYMIHCSETWFLQNSICLTSLRPKCNIPLKALPMRKNTSKQLNLCFP